MRLLDCEVPAILSFKGHMIVAWLLDCQVPAILSFKVHMMVAWLLQARHITPW
jgi:hypothetical protein